MKRLFLHVAACVASVALTPPASAAESTPDVTTTSLSLGARSGFAQPLGRAFSTSGALSSVMYGALPVQIDLGGRFPPHLYVGAEAQLGFALMRDCTSCSGEDARISLLVAWYFDRDASHLAPWLGLSGGYEVLTLHQSADRRSVDTSMRGFELLGVEAGVDQVAPTPAGAWRWGPFLRGSLARFDAVAIDGDAMTNDGALVHAWIMLGLRGGFDLHLGRL